MFNFSSEINFGQLLQTFGNFFFWSDCIAHATGRLSEAFKYFAGMYN